MKYILLISFTLFSNMSVACSHNLMLSVPNLEGDQAFLQALDNSKGKTPKPFDLQALFDDKSSAAQVHLHDHDHDHEHENSITKALDRKIKSATQYLH